MTILFLSPSFYPAIGGVEKHVLEIAKRLSGENKVVIITQGNKNVHEFIQGIEIYRFYFGKNNWLKKFIIWDKLFKNRKIIETADVVHCHDVFFWYLPFRIFYPSKKVFVTFHGFEGVFPPTFKSILLRRLSEKLSSGNIIVGKYIEKWYGTKPNFITYGGVNLIRNSKIKIRQKTKIKVLFVGRIEEDNGVKIYSKVLTKLKNCEFEAIGDGNLRYEFERFGKVNGFVKNVSSYIKKSDVIFASSYLSILEALSLKKPVFSVYQNPLKRDYLEKTPFSQFINISNSSPDLLIKIKKYLKNPKIFDPNPGYNWVRRETWDKVARLYLNLYGL